MSYFNPNKLKSLSHWMGSDFIRPTICCMSPKNIHVDYGIPTVCLTDWLHRACQGNVNLSGTNLSAHRLSNSEWQRTHCRTFLTLCNPANTLAYWMRQPSYQVICCYNDCITIKKNNNTNVCSLFLGCSVVSLSFRNYNCSFSSFFFFIYRELKLSH